MQCAAKTLILQKCICLSFAPHTSAFSATGWKRNGVATGYSGTPLAKKLSLRDGMRCWFHAMPDDVQDEIDELDNGLAQVQEQMQGYLKELGL